MPLLPAWAVLIVALSVDPSPPVDRCRGGPLDRAAVIHCAQRDDPRVAADRAALEAVAARQRTARVVLPSQPELDVSGATRSARGIPRNWNLYATLRQEVEVGGQRRRRMDVAEAEHALVDAQGRTTRQELTAAALHAYYAVLAARERSAVVEQAQRVSAALAGLAQGRVKAGAEAGLSADLAEIAAVALDRRVLDQARDEAVAEAMLARSLGLAPDELPAVVGELAPIPVPMPEGDAPPDASGRSELAEAAAAVRLRSRETELVRRALVPNPRFSVFVQRDGFAELVLGAGVAMPLPVPAFAGPLAKGRTAEARAREREATHGRDAVARGVQLQAELALAELRAREATAALYEHDMLTRAREDLDAIATALGEGQLDVRSALLAQQQLIEFLEADIDARHALCAASIAAARALGVDWQDRP